MMNTNLLSTLQTPRSSFILHPSSFLYSLLPAACSLLMAAGPAFQVQRLAGDAVVGPIVDLSAERVTVQTPDGPVSLETDEIAGISSPAVPNRPVGLPQVWVELADGSRLAAADYSARDGLARITRLGGELVELSARDVAAVELQPQTDAIVAEWSRIRDLDLAGDLLVIRKAHSLDYHRGVAGDVTDKTVQFDLEGDVLPVKKANVQGLIYYQSAGRSLPDPVCRIAQRDGSLWQARSIRLEGDDFHWTTPLGLESGCAQGEVVRIDFSQGKIVFLSDLEPESLVWTPYFGPAAGTAAKPGTDRQVGPLPSLFEFFSPREDRGLEPGLLELDGKQYRKGLALHSRTSLAYRLPGQFRRFTATVGIDDRVRPRGNVRLVIRGDDRVLLEKTVAGTDPPEKLDLDLAGVRRLAILVDYGEDLDVADHLDLCDAKIVK